jgi:hypothetical protein
MINLPPLGGSDSVIAEENKKWDEYLAGLSDEELEVEYYLLAQNIARGKRSTTSYVLTLVAKNGSERCKMMLANNPNAGESFSILAKNGSKSVIKELMKNDALTVDAINALYNRFLGDDSFDKEFYKDNYEISKNYFINYPYELLLNEIKDTKLNLNCKNLLNIMIRKI